MPLVEIALSTLIAHLTPLSLFHCSVPLFISISLIILRSAAMPTCLHRSACTRAHSSHSLTISAPNRRWRPRRLSAAAATATPSPCPPPRHRHPRATMRRRRPITKSCGGWRSPPRPQRYTASDQNVFSENSDIPKKVPAIVFFQS